MPEMKVPGPDHPISVVADPRRLRVRYQGHVIGDSEKVLTLTEASYPPVAYFPREDISMEYLSRTEKVSYCPYKGEARYFTLLMDGHFAENAVWSYEDPFPAMDTIRGRLAFYPNQVEIYAYGEAADAEAVREAVEHTDDGAGRSQLEPWPANAGLPREV
jgi:uncharacterized protein (DUF427 family)